MVQPTPHLEIQACNGQLRPVTMESSLLSTAEATEIARTLTRSMTSFQPKPTADLHLTLLHIGQPETLWTEIVQSGPSIDFKLFFGHFMTLLEASHGMIPDPFWLEVEGLAEFGNPSEPAIVLHLASTHWLLSAREQLLEMLSQMLANCGVLQPLIFIDKSFNLHHQLPEHYKPHVSLGRVPSNQHIPNIDVSGLRLGFGPSKLRNVSTIQ